MLTSKLFDKWTESLSDLWTFKPVLTVLLAITVTPIILGLFFLELLLYVALFFTGLIWLFDRSIDYHR